SRGLPRVISATLIVEAGVSFHAAPADLMRVKYATWGDDAKRRLPRWDPDYPMDLPRLSLAEEAGVRKLALMPAPTAQQISVCGAEYPYRYYARHILSDIEGETTLPEDRRDLLLLRAAAEALRELAVRNIHKPVQMRDGLHSAPRNGTPAALYELLMQEYRGQAWRAGCT
ncbi:MAG TPA: hypothetical protein VEC14_09465, partial [Reyranellaceae bacterium]|nr:hypothetical protein [Reyranellaceae bacterium]